MTDIYTKVDQMDHKLKIEFELYKVMRIIDVAKDVDDDRLQGIVGYVTRYIIELNEDNSSSVRNYKHSKKALINYVKKNYSNLFTESLMSSGNQIVAASLPSTTTTSSGAIGIGVLYASNLNFDDRSKEKKK